MKGYCTRRDVRLALTPSADETDASTASSLPDWQIDDAIEEAEGIVDSYVSMRYTIPVSEIEETNPEDPGETWIWMVAPVPIRGLTRDVAAYLSALTYRRSKDMEEDDPIRLRYAVALSLLTAIRDRTASLPPEFPPVDADDQGVYVANLYEGKLFDMHDVGLVPAGYDPQVYIPLRRDV